jgi:hypothetical protein
MLVVHMLFSGLLVGYIEHSAFSIFVTAKNITDVMLHR